MAIPGFTDSGPLAGGNPIPSTYPPTPIAQISIGETSITDDRAQYKNTDNAADIYTDYMVYNRYEKDYHRYMMGVTSPGGFQGGTVAFVQLATPTLLWVSEWTACRLNTQPKIPDSTSKDSNWILLDEHIEPVMLGLAADGVTALYRINGTFVYGHRNPARALINNITYARPPWMEDSFTRVVPASALEQDIISNSKQSVTAGTPGGSTGFPGVV